jgi:phosphatidylglycerophosphate synthase
MRNSENRRPLKSRGTQWAKGLAAALARLGVAPNAISAASIVLAAMCVAGLLFSAQSHGAERVLALILAVLGVQLRLLCNLFDGMVAMEHRRASTSGPIWNELPDRFADTILLVGAGYAAAVSGQHGASVLGWIAASAALLTAYVRELGRGFGFPADFGGPMAKPHRMAVLTVAILASMFEPLWQGRGESLAAGLLVVAAGSAITLLLRTRRLSRRLAVSRPNVG